MKKLLSKIAIIIVMSCLFMSCGTPMRTYAVSKEKDYQEAFIGAKHNEIVSAYGAPDRQTSDGAGGTILIYEKTTTTTTSNSQAAAYNVNYVTGTYTPGSYTNSSTTQSTSYIHFFISDDGVCYNVKSNHQRYVTEVDEERKAKNRKIGIIAGSTIGGFYAVLLAVLFATGV